jgi:Ser/Thr protein kinase RdoA (MazF antagonist)
MIEIHPLAPASGKRPSRVLAVDEVCRHWDLGEWRDLQRALEGKANVSHFVTTDKGGFVVRISNGRKTEASMAWEVAFLDDLCARGFPSPRVVPTRSGSAWAWVDGSLCFITERIPGESMDPEHPVHRRESMVALAWFHEEAAQVPAAAQPSSRSRVPILESGPAVLGELQQVVAEFVGLADLDRFRRVREAFEPAYAATTAGLAAAQLPEIVTHGSFGPTAVLFDDDRLTGVLDFERAAWELRTLDLGYTMRGLARNRQVEGAWDLRGLSDLAAAYGSRQPLTPVEVDCFPAVLRAQRLIRVANKAANLMRKHAGTPQEEKDGLKLVQLLELEAVRVGWITAHETELIEAVAAGAG